MKYIALIVALCFAFASHAQESQNVWTITDVLQQVRQYHPIVKQAGVNIEIADAERLASRGAFDPQLNHYSASKTLDGTQYYNYHNPQITVPTLYGPNVVVGTEYLSGGNIDPTETKGYSSYIGVNIPLAQGLLYDKRRAILHKAQVYYQMSEVEQRAMVNDILMQSIDCYWHWVKQYEFYNIISKNVAVTAERFVLVKKAYANGERPAIDTVELLAQLSSFELLKQQEWLGLQQARIELSTFLWLENNTPITLDDSSKPNPKWQVEEAANTNNKALEEWLVAASGSHPLLQQYDNKLQALNIDKRLAKQALLPKVDFQYNQLGKDWALHRTLVTGPLFTDNNQWNLKVSMPLLLREARGSYKVAELNILQNKLQRAQKLNLIQNKVQSYYVEYLSLQKQIDIQRLAYTNYSRLVYAEEQKFFNGESSIFLINSRENKALEALEKLVELQTKLGKVQYSIQWAAGMLK
jgi:outer membrane protein TolC